MRTSTVVAGLAVVLAVGGLLLGCGGSAQPTAPPASVDGATLLQERCTVCHGLDRTTSAQKTREEWAQTVTRMVGKGAELNDGEQETLIDYLTETYAP